MGYEKGKVIMQGIHKAAIFIIHDYWYMQPLSAGPNLYVLVTESISLAPTPFCGIVCSHPSDPNPSIFYSPNFYTMKFVIGGEKSRERSEGLSSNIARHAHE